MEITERIKYIMKLNNLSASAFADKVGVQRSSVSHILSGRNKPSLDFVLKVLHHFPNVSSDWLLLGKTDVTNVKSHYREGDNMSEENEFTGVNFTKSTENEGSSEDDVNVVTNVNKVESRENIERIVIFYSDGTFSDYKKSKD